MSRSRLEIDSPALASTLTTAGRPALTDLIHRACQRAVRETSLAEPATPDALEAIRAGRTDPDLARSLAAVAERLDDEYLGLVPEGGDVGDLSEEALLPFRKARAMTALRLAIEAPLTWESASEAIYEAAHACDDPPDVYHMLLESL